MLAWAKGLLGHVPLYVALQRAIGADQLRNRCISELELKPGECVLDVGCGPAYYFERLPAVRYIGFDTDRRYIDYARRRWGDRAEFRCEAIAATHLAELPQADAVLLMGLLHHLSDDESANLLNLAARLLAQGGRVISLDTWFEPSQGRIARWMSENDRGGHVRQPEGFLALAREAFDAVDGEILSGVTRVPSSFWLMRMRSPAHSSTARSLAHARSESLPSWQGVANPST